MYSCGQKTQQFAISVVSLMSHCWREAAKQKKQQEKSTVKSYVVINGILFVIL